MPPPQSLREDWQAGEANVPPQSAWPVGRDSKPLPHPRQTPSADLERKDSSSTARSRQPGSYPAGTTILQKTRPAQSGARIREIPEVCARPPFAVPERHSEQSPPGGGALREEGHRAAREPHSRAPLQSAAGCDGTLLYPTPESRGESRRLLSAIPARRDRWEASSSAPQPATAAMTSVPRSAMRRRNEESAAQRSTHRVTAGAVWRYSSRGHSSGPSCPDRSFRPKPARREPRISRQGACQAQCGGAQNSTP